MRNGGWVFLCFALLTLAVSVSAQETLIMSAQGDWVPLRVDGETPAIGPETGDPNIYGSQDWSLTWYRAADFTERDSTREIDMDISNNCFFQTGSGNNYLFANVDLPNGSLINWVEVYGVDSDAVDDVLINFCHTWVDAASGDNGSGNCPYIDSTSGTPAGFYKTMAINETVLKRQDIDTDGTVETVTYNLYVGNIDGANLCVFGVRLLWKRQPSPAPASATFGDVGTGYWAFRFIEALADSGITAGCGSGNFCPDGTVTRAEMAVFLSAALGLHWNPFDPPSP
jgi:hypothetical protein